MACSVNLFTGLLGGTPNPGGNWTFITPASGSYDFLVNGLPVSLSAGNTVGTGHLVTVDVTDTPTGTYVFRYTVAGAGIGCSATADVTMNVVAGAVAGTSTSFTLCNTTNQAYNIYNLVRGGSTIPSSGPENPGTELISTTGTWSGTGVASSGHTAGTSSPTDNTFNPNTVTPGTYVFTYTVNQGGTCENCVDTADVTFIVVAAPNAGTANSITVCNDTPA